MKDSEEHKESTETRTTLKGRYATGISDGLPCLADFHAYSKLPEAKGLEAEHYRDSGVVVA